MRPIITMTKRLSILYKNEIDQLIEDVQMNGSMTIVDAAAILAQVQVVEDVRDGQRVLVEYGSHANLPTELFRDIAHSLVDNMSFERMSWNVFASLADGETERITSGSLRNVAAASGTSVHIPLQDLMGLVKFFDLDCGGGITYRDFYRLLAAEASAEASSH